MAAHDGMKAYRLVEPIGRGGMGEVWKAEHRHRGDAVAIKFMLHERGHTPRELGAFRSEVRAIARLHHPRISAILDYGELTAPVQAGETTIAAGSPWFAMEFAAGGTLADRFTQVRSWPDVQRIVLQVLDGLAHAHARGIVHRDLKPANILFLRDDLAELALADFGIAHAIAARSEAAVPEDDRHVPIAGTPGFMAPEQWMGDWRRWDAWTDLWAVGAIAWRLVCDSLPFSGRRALFASERPVFAPTFAVGEGFEEWLRRLLRREPYARFERAADAAYALSRLRGPTVPPSGAHSPLDPSSVTTLAALVDGPTWADAPTELMSAAARTRHASESAEGILFHPSYAHVPPMPEDWGERATRPPASANGLGLLGLREVPLLGRHRERDLLWQTLADVRATSSARVVVVRGPTAVGKRALLAWFAHRVHELGAATPLAQLGTQGATAGTVRDVLARFFRCEGLPPEALRERVGWLVQRFGGSDAASQAIDGMVAILSPPDAPTALQLTARERTFAFALVFNHLASVRPTVLAVSGDNIDGEVVAFAKLAATQKVCGRTMVLLCVDSDDESQVALVSPLLDRAGVEGLDLEPLTDDEQLRLLESHVALDMRTLAALALHSRGQPLVGVELLRLLADRGDLSASETGITTPVEIDELPATLGAVWAARIATAGATQGNDAEAAYVAALLGSDFRADEWEAACRHAGSALTDEFAGRLVEQGMLQSTPTGFSFTHRLMHSALAEQLDRDRVRRLHTACGDAVVERFASSPDAAVRAAEHLRLGGWPTRALIVGLNSLATIGSRASTVRSALADVVTRVLRELEDPGAVKLDEGTALGLFRALDAQSRSPGFDRETAALYFRLCDDQRVLTRGVGHALRAIAGWKLSTTEEVLAHLDEACRLLDPTGRRPQYWGVVHQRARALIMVGRIADAFESLEGLDSLRERLLPAEWGQILAMRGEALRRLGRLDETRSVALEARALFERAQYTYGIAMIEYVLGDVERAALDYPASERHLRRAVHELERIGGADETTALLSLALTWLAAGKLTEALPQLQRLATVFDNDGNTSHKALAQMAIGAVHAEMGELEAARDTVAHVVRLVEAEPLVDEDLEQLAARILGAAHDTELERHCRRVIELMRERGL